jgi:hypothetical protein
MLLTSRYAIYSPPRNCLAYPCGNHNGRWVNDPENGGSKFLKTGGSMILKIYPPKWVNVSEKSQHDTGLKFQKKPLPHFRIELYQCLLRHIPTAPRALGRLAENIVGASRIPAGHEIEGTIKRKLSARIPTTRRRKDVWSCLRNFAVNLSWQGEC